MTKISIAKARRLRTTPYTSRIEKQGLSAYSVYNHMLLPAGFDVSLEESYHHLKKHVQNGLHFSEVNRLHFSKVNIMN